MRASELMIGDWVYILNFPERGKKTPVKIIGMDTNHNAIEYVHNGIRLWSAVVRLEPIPIAPEILKKNGFTPETYDDHILVLNEKSGEVIYYGCEQDYGLTIDNQYSTIQELKIQFLHELQNALRLCKIEKEIEL